MGDEQFIDQYIIDKNNNLCKHDLSKIAIMFLGLTYLEVTDTSRVYFS